MTDLGLWRLAGDAGYLAVKFMSETVSVVTTM